MSINAPYVKKACNEAYADGKVRGHNEALLEMAPRINELIEANNRFEQRGRMAERFARLLEQSILSGAFRPSVSLDMLTSLLVDYRKDFPRK